MRDIVVIGASAGGVTSLWHLVQALPANLRAAIFIVVHMPAKYPSWLPNILDSCQLPSVHATDGAAIEPAHIYVAPPDRHLLIEPQSMRVVFGPKENRFRPAIDSLFRTAALAYGKRVVGVVLSGALNDGTAGLIKIKEQGGIAIVQDPKEALFPGMPESAIKHAAVDYVLPIAKIAATLVKLADEPMTNGEKPVCRIL